VVAAGGAVANADFGNGEVHALLLQLLVGQSRLAHQLRACAVEPDQIVGMIDHAHLIGFGIIDPQRYRADHAGAKSTAGPEKSNTTAACGLPPRFLAWGPCSPRPAC